MENILPRREARENAFLLAFSQTFGDVPCRKHWIRTTSVGKSVRWMCSASAC